MKHGLEADTAKNRREFSRGMEGICAVDLAGEYQPLRRGWKLGGEDFCNWLADKLARGRREGERARERREIDHVLAERLTQSCLREVGWDMGNLKRERKGMRSRWKLRGSTDAHSDDSSMDRTTFTHGERWLPSNPLADDDIKL